MRIGFLNNQVPEYIHLRFIRSLTVSSPLVHISGVSGHCGADPKCHKNKYTGIFHFSTVFLSERPFGKRNGCKANFTAMNINYFTVNKSAC